MKRNAWLIVAAALLILCIGTFALWKTVGNPCSTPVLISSIEEPPSSYSPDKSGAKRYKVAMDGTLAAFQYVLDAGKKTRTSYDPSETLMVVVLEGSGQFQSAHFDEKQQLIWFQEAPIKTGDFLTIPANIVYQFEASDGGPLRYLMFSSKGSQAKDRLFLREEHPSLFPCRREEASLKKVGDLSPQSESDHTDLDRVRVMP